MSSEFIVACFTQQRAIKIRTPTVACVFRILLPHGANTPQYAFELLKTTKEYSIKIATANIEVLASPTRAGIVLNDNQRTVQ
jgi:hypothetical protein